MHDDVKRMDKGAIQRENTL